MRLELDVRETFDGMARRLREIGGVVADPALVRAAAAEDSTAARRLFEAAATAIASEESSTDAALTVFAPDRTPLAWAGRPSELPQQQLAAGETWFVSFTSVRCSTGRR
jgi:hypothetical protein